MKGLCVFEDWGYRSLLPLTHLRPTYGLRCGMHALLDRILQFYRGENVTLFCRDWLADTVRESAGFPVNLLPEAESVLFLNGRLLLETPIPLEGGEEVGVRGDTLVYARLGMERARGVGPAGFLERGLHDRLRRAGVRAVDSGAELPSYVWDLVRLNAGVIERDFSARDEGGLIEGTVHGGAHLLNRPMIRVGRGSSVKPGAVLDAGGGPVYIGEGVEIQPGAVIEGPAFVGDRSLIKAGAVIHGGTSIGEVCKVGGEVDASIIHSFSNKQHFGFIGHSYVGMWCNIGAGTSNSDLKNNYSSVRVELEGGVVDSGLAFFGMAMGDHTKTGIHTAFSTGSVIGVMTSVFASGALRKFIPSFSWLDPNGIAVYDPSKALADARKVMARRDRQLTPAGERLLLTVFDQTREERALRMTETPGPGLTGEPDGSA